MDVSAFRAAFPQFREDLFADARIAFWLKVAEKTLPAGRWGELFPEGAGLYAAHQLTLEAAAGKAQDGTGGLDAAAGPVTATSKAVGGVSLSETRGGSAASGAANLNAGHWNLTVYGQQFWQLAMLVGAGGVQI